MRQESCHPESRSLFSPYCADVLLAWGGTDRKEGPVFVNGDSLMDLERQLSSRVKSSWAIMAEGGFDPCECVCSHEHAMRRLINLYQGPLVITASVLP
ncbi:small integral membrane protein 14 isoform X3 [Ailuropoda melanoleuca]|uniref:small integral membrane protein 14 isoform X3 n=1 Tax=Ailuropoda melanoleuca TaxID=9646 RepID=UPI001494CF3C|nr:small integral membrane protein 14 isoform X3 [Ailuropoda melanoleuca]